MPKSDDSYVCYLGWLGQYFLRGLSESNPANLQQWSKQARKRKRKKLNKDIKQRGKQKFLALGDLVRSSKNIFIKGNSMFLACQFLRQQQTYMMEQLRDKVILLRLTTMRYFLSRKEAGISCFCQRRVSALEDPRKTCFRIFDHKLTEEGSVK